MINNKSLISKLVEKYGSPLYLFDKTEFIKNYNYFIDCMSSEYDKYQLAYSYKTNYTPYICKIVKELGGYAEVVSDMEYYFAKTIGYEDDHIIYNGPFKGELSHRMLLNGGLLNIDNLDELDTLIKLAKANKDKILRVGLRVNTDIGQPFISRFGIDSDSNDLEIAINRINEVENMTIHGIHLHVGQSRTVQLWQNRAEKMIDIIDKYFNGIKLKYMDLGSGMYGKMDDFLGDQFSKKRPSYQDYAKAIGEKINEYYRGYSYEDKPIVFTEPGTTMINHYIDFVGTVHAIKKIRGRQFVVLDSSKLNLGEICTLKALPISVVNNSPHPEELKDAIIVGYTCLEHDVMLKAFDGKLAVGDNIIFGNVGGYSNVDKPPFILPNCPMLSVEGDKVEVIKRKETYDDILSTYVI